METVYQPSIIALGPKGSYGSIVANQINMDTGGSFLIDYVLSNSKILPKMLENAENLGAIPVENTYGGVVHENVMPIGRNADKIQVLGWIPLRVEHCLAGLPESDVGSIFHVYSHPQALEQCHKNISKLGMEGVETPATTTQISLLRKHEAVICSRPAAEANNLQILDYSFAPPDNITRFAIFGSKDRSTKLDLPLLIQDRVIAIISLSDEVGSLAWAMTVIANMGLSAHFIESMKNRHTGGMDFLTVIDNKSGISISEEAKRNGVNIRVL